MFIKPKFKNRRDRMFNFDNIGGKIKILAKVTCWIGSISSVIGGVIMMLNGLAYENTRGILGGIMIAVLGDLVSWVGSFRLYGFGQLIENSDIIANQYRKTEDRKEWSRQEAQKVKTALNDEKINENEWIDLTCPNCGEQLSFTKAQIQGNPKVDCPSCGYEIDFNEMSGNK